MMKMEPVRVLVVGDDPLARAGLSALLAGREGVLVTGEASTLDAGRVLAGRDHDAVAWDPGPDGRAGAERIRAAVETGVPVVALLAGGGAAAEALRAGARALVFRDAEPDRIAAALAAATRGLVVLEPGLAAEWLREPHPATSGEPLTPREREVLALLSEGIGNKAIAARLGISEHTAKFHVNAILAKLGAGSRAEAIVLAARQGLVVI